MRMESPTEALDGEIKASRGFRRKRKSVARLDGVSSRLLTTMAIVRATAEDDRESLLVASCCIYWPAVHG